MGFVSDIFGGGGDDSAKAAIKGSETQAQAQREALQYLKETEAVPQKYREASLGQLANIYGIGGDPAAQEEFYASLTSSPIYKAMMGSQAAGEESILRNASATGGLRSGNTSYNLADYNTRLKNEALLTSYNNQVSGLQGLAGLPSLAPSIAGGISDIGQTLAQGQIAASQAKQSGNQAGFGNVMGLANLGLSAYSAFSDKRLKSNVYRIGSLGGHNVYAWKWNAKANEIGLNGYSMGVMADEIQDDYPHLVGESLGYKTVNYGGLNV